MYEFAGPFGQSIPRHCSLAPHVEKVGSVPRRQATVSPLAHSLQQIRRPPWAAPVERDRRGVRAMRRASDQRESFSANDF